MCLREIRKLLIHKYYGKVIETSISPSKATIHTISEDNNFYYLLEMNVFNIYVFFFFLFFLGKNREVVQRPRDKS